MMSFCKFGLILLFFGIGYAKISYKKVTAAKYGSALLHCNPSGQRLWWSDSSNRTIKDKPGKYTIFYNGTLKVENVTRLDVGVYKCHIRDTIISTIFVKLVISTETIVSTVHSDVTLNCKAEVPRNQIITDVVYKFYYIHSNRHKNLLSEKGKLTEHGKEFGQGRLRTTENGLQINGIERKNQGTFLCTAQWKSENHMGFEEYFFNVEVHGENPRRSTPQNKDGPKTKEPKKRNIKSSGKVERNICCLTIFMSIVALKFVVKWH